MARNFSFEVLPDLTFVFRYDEESARKFDEERLKRSEAQRVAKRIARAEAKSPAPRRCVDLGMQTGTTKGCLCGQRNLEFPVYWCNRFQLECTESPTSATGAYKVCKRCNHGPWADLLK